MFCQNSSRLGSFPNLCVNEFILYKSSEGTLRKLIELLEDFPGKRGFIVCRFPIISQINFYQDVLLNVISIENQLRLQASHIKSKSNVKRSEWSHGVPCISNNSSAGALLRCKHAI